jgi:hypothetical protein
MPNNPNQGVGTTRMGKKHAFLALWVNKSLKKAHGTIAVDAHDWTPPGSESDCGSPLAGACRRVASTLYLPPMA